MLLDVVNICDRNGITYYLSSGTLLGAVRHNGFIPWDDDIDVVLHREDYNKLKHLAKKGVFSTPYFFQNPNTDIGFPKGYCRLRNSDTTEIPIMDVYEKCNHGVFIDIFPLDNIPDNVLLYKKQLGKMKKIRSIMNAYSRYHSGVGAMGGSGKEKIAYSLISVLFKLNILKMPTLYDKYDKIASKFSDISTKRVGTIAGTFDNERFIFDSKLWDAKTILIPFEDIKVPIPESYDEILKNSYGNYMTPKREKTNHGETFFSVAVPYKLFIEENKEMLMKKRFEKTFVGRSNKKKEA